MKESMMTPAAISEYVKDAIKSFHNNLMPQSHASSLPILLHNAYVEKILLR